MLSPGRVAHRIQPSTGNQGRFVLQGYLGWRRLETIWLPLTQTLEQAPIQSEHEASRPVLRSANDSDDELACLDELLRAVARPPASKKRIIYAQGLQRS